MRKRIIPAALLSLSIVAAACGDDETSTTTAASTAPSESTDGGTGTTVGGDCALTEPLKIGYAADMSELGAAADGPGVAAAQFMIDQINAAGGVGGQQVEFASKDVQGDPAATQRAAQELIDDGVDAIIGPPFANTGAPLIDTVNGALPIVFMSSTDPSLADPSRGAFLATFSDPVQSAAMAEFALAEGHTTAVTFSSTDDIYFSGNPEYFTTVFQAGGGSVLADFSYSLGDADFSTQVNEIASLSETPQVLFTAMIMPLVQTLIEQLDAAGLGDIVVMGVDAFDATGIVSAGTVADGVFFSAHTYPTDGNGVQKFLDDAAAAGTAIETISFGALAADAVQIIAAAATEACSTDGATLIETVNNLVNVPVTTGTVTFKDTNGVPEKDVVILTIEGGEIAFVQALRPTNIPS
ncbi:MAG: ABC transporter substrate-binding protein [Actinomycetota bacterium]|nr:ABC transporter substrate-binding protein [Actinomycetota bacterium]